MTYDFVIGSDPLRREFPLYEGGTYFGTQIELSMIMRPSEIVQSALVGYINVCEQIFSTFKPPRPYDANRICDMARVE